MGKNILIANAELLKSIINTLATPIFIKDQDHKWILVNDSFCEFMGKSREELIGRSDYDFFPRKEADVFREKDKEVFASRSVNINIENFTDSANQTHIIETRKKVFHNSEWGDVLCGVITDITQLKQYQNELNELNAHLQKQVTERTIDLQEANKKLAKMAYVDKLTGLMNRSAIDELFQDYINQSIKTKPTVLRFTVSGYR
ncbi:PAS domain S-box protein [Marinicella sp. W31]|uniref:PAS domain-containing protein n=1 Tax=Marinicella sp. W31 TaxID=3023713 RepID=UPI003757C1D4